jgi:cytochrome c-type biogenesis protein CcmE
MTRKQRRSLFIGGGLAVLGLAAFLVLSALNDSIVFFYSPSDIVEKSVKPDQRFRLGGLVPQGSFKRVSGASVQFSIGDGKETIHVAYTGLLPDLFREGQGVVVEGKLDASGRFVADTVLAKHDENYMPREVADSLKEKGLWQHNGTQPKQASQ